MIDVINCLILEVASSVHLMGIFDKCYCT